MAPVGMKNETDYSAQLNYIIYYDDIKVVLYSQL